MKRWFFLVSLVLIVSGLAVLASGYYPTKKEEEYRLAYVHNIPVQNSTDGIYSVIEGTTIGVFIPSNASAGAVRPNPAQWTVSANLTEGDMITVPITQGTDWPEGYFEIDDYYTGVGALYVQVNITDPRGNFTLFDMMLGKAPEGTASGRLYFLQTFRINITDPSYNQGGLDTTPFYRNSSNSYLRIGGIAQLNGTYTVTFIPPWPARNYPVTSLEIRKHTTRTVYSTQYALPAGITILSAGVVLNWVSMKKGPKTSHNRKVYADLRKQKQK